MDKGSAPEYSIGWLRQLWVLVFLQEFVQYSDSELDRVHRHAFVYAVEHAGEIQFGWKLQRRKTVSGDIQLGQPFVIGSARKHIRQHYRVRIFGQQGLD